MRIVRVTAKVRVRLSNIVKRGMTTHGASYRACLCESSASANIGLMTGWGTRVACEIRVGATVRAAVRAAVRATFCNRILIRVRIGIGTVCRVMLEIRARVGVTVRGTEGPSSASCCRWTTPSTEVPRVSLPPELGSQQCRVRVRIRLSAM